MDADRIRDRARHRRVRREKESVSCGRTPVYVGQTALTADQRFAQHKSGVKASKWVTKYGLRVLPELAQGYGEMATVAESEAAEVELAQTLRVEGRWCVYGGH